MHTLKLTQIGNSVGVILPREMLAKLGMTKGDTIYVTTDPASVHVFDTESGERLSD